MPDRCTPEYERVLAKMGALLPYRRAHALLGEFFALEKAPDMETIRQRTLRVGARLEREAVAPPTTSPPNGAKSIALAIDGGHVKAVRSYQQRSFEVFVAQVSNDDGKQIVFSSMPAEADRQVRQLRGVLHDLGATPNVPITILSDGADGPRNLGEAASTGPTHHVLDWFHLSMRIQHVAQTVKGFHGDHGEYGAVAASPADGREPADAMVTEGRSFDAEGSGRGHERDLQPEPRHRRALGPSVVSHRGVTRPPGSRRSRAI